VTGNDPNDASVPSTSLMQQAWVQHLVGRWGRNAAGGLRYYILDNEPSLWHAPTAQRLSRSHPATCGSFADAECQRHASIPPTFADGFEHRETEKQRRL
jgi:hypothetical protein